MAGSNWGSPNDPDRRRLENERRLEGSSAAWFGWWWLWIVIIILFFGWFAGWGWGSYGGWWGWGNRGRAVLVEPTRTVIAVGVPQLLNNSQSFSGRQITVPSSTVQEVVAPHEIWIGPSSNQAVLVTLADATGAPVNKGDTVQVTGTVQNASNPPNNLKLDNNGQKQLQSDGVYIVASNVHPVIGGNGNNTRAAR